MKNILWKSGGNPSNSGSQSFFMAKVAIGIVSVGMATYLLVSKYNGKELIRRLRMQNQEVTLSQRCAKTKKKIDQMWIESPSLVHQDVNYTMLKQFGIDFAIGKNNRAGLTKKNASSSSLINIGGPNSISITEIKAESAAEDSNPGKLKSEQT